VAGFFEQGPGMFLAMQANNISQVARSIRLGFSDFEVNQSQPEHDQILLNRLNMPQPAVGPA
jgi:hypothetical protein